MNNFVIQRIVKVTALFGVALACQSVFAGVGINVDVTNETPADFTVTSCPPGFICADDETVKVTAGQTAPKVTYREAPYSYEDVSYSVTIPIYINDKKLNVCDITFSGITYAWGVPPRIKDEGLKTVNYQNKYNYTCEAGVTKDAASSGDTENIIVTVNANVPIQRLDPPLASLRPAAPVRKWTCPRPEDLTVTTTDRPEGGEEVKASGYLTSDKGGNVALSSGQSVSTGYRSNFDQYVKLGKNSISCEYWGVGKRENPIYLDNSIFLKVENQVSRNCHFNPAAKTWPEGDVMSCSNQEAPCWIVCQ